MSLHVTFLGTSCSTPTPERNLSSMALTFRGNWFLFDTPEGVQQQIMRAGLSYLKLKHIFISHFHGDHTLGLPGLLATMSIHERKDPLYVWGPRGIEQKVKEAIALADFFPSFQIVPLELREGDLVKDKEFIISAVKLNHSCACYGFVFETPGKSGEFQRAKALKLKIPEGPLWGKLQKGETITHSGKKFTPEMVMDYSKAMKGATLAYIMDTFPHAHYMDALKGVDYLIHESSFLESERERAVETKHSTARMAGEIAKRTGARELILTHFSPRYPNGKEMEKEAKSAFPHVRAAHDLMSVELADRFEVNAAPPKKKAVRKTKK